MPLQKYPGQFSVATVPIEVSPATPKDHGVLASIFYPTESTSESRSKWIVGPRTFYSTGYGDYIKLSRWISAGPMSWILESFRMPARKGSALHSGGDKRDKLPVAIFCHGLAGNQTTYSSFCGMLASRGFVVLSLEHRDGSASVTGRSNYSERINYKKQPDDQDDYTFRNGQLIQRGQEVHEALQLLKDLNDGKAIDNLLGNAVPDMKGRLDLSNAVLTGHSFGGATAMYVLQQQQQPFVAGIIFDPWMLAIPSPSDPITVPMLSVQSEFFHWPANIRPLREIWDASSKHASNQFAVVRGTKHQDMSDMPSLVHGVLKLVGKQGKVAPNVVLGAYDSLSGAFLQKALKGLNAVADEIVVADVGKDVVVYDDAAFVVLQSRFSSEA